MKTARKYSTICSTYVLRLTRKGMFFQSIVYLFLILFSPPLFSGQHSLVFVHLGKAAPPSLFSVLRQARTFNETCPIFLLSDHTFHRSDFFEEQQITPVLIQTICKGSEHEEFDQKNQIDPLLSDGLWYYSLKRFFYLYDFIRERSLSNVFHLENDTMLYTDLDELDFSFFSLAAPFESTTACIPCFVFIKNGDELRKLILSILTQVRNYRGFNPQNGVNDMSTCARAYQTLRIPSPLPTSPCGYRPSFVLRKEYYSKKVLSLLSENSSKFPNHLFDASTFGIFITGRDSRFSSNLHSRTCSPRSYLNPYDFSLFWGEDKKGRPVPFAQYSDKTYRIVNLHFHSKRTEGYESYKTPLAPFP